MTSPVVKASAAIPRIYRMRFQRDIYKDLRTLEKAVSDGSEEQSNLDVFSLEMFENIAYVMAKHAGPSMGTTVAQKKPSSSTRVFLSSRL